MDQFDVDPRWSRPEPGEETGRNQGKAWKAFKLFRNMGPDRTIKDAAALYFNTTKALLTDSQFVQVRKWAVKHDWNARAQAHDDHYEMFWRTKMEEAEQEKAADFAERRIALKDRMLGCMEKACEQAEKMLEWPLTQQKVVREEGEDGTEQVTYIFTPAGWNKSTVATYLNLAGGAVTGHWVTAKVQEEEPDQYDWSEFTEEELQQFSDMVERVKPKR